MLLMIIVTTVFGEGYKLWNSSLFSSHHSPITGRYIFYNTTFPNISNVCSSFSVTLWFLRIQHRRVVSHLQLTVHPALQRHYTVRQQINNSKVLSRYLVATGNWFELLT